MFEKNVENLRRAREYLSDPKNWACGFLFGKERQGKAPPACALGALSLAMNTVTRCYPPPYAVETAFLNAASYKLFEGRGIDSVNDAGPRGFRPDQKPEEMRQAVLEAYDAAICVLERCETKEEAMAAIAEMSPNGYGHPAHLDKIAFGK